MILSKKRITKALIRLRGCAGWSAPVLFANSGRQVFSLYENRNANSMTQTHLPVKVLDVKKLTNIMSLIKWLRIDLVTGLRLAVFARG